MLKNKICDLITPDLIRFHSPHTNTLEVDGFHHRRHNGENTHINLVNDSQVPSLNKAISPQPLATIEVGKAILGAANCERIRADRIK